MKNTIFLYYLKYFMSWCIVLSYITCAMMKSIKS